MEIGKGDLARISHSSLRAGLHPRLKVIAYLKEAPVLEVLLSDGENALSFLVDPKIAATFTSATVPVNSVIELTNYEIITDSPKTVRILAFRTPSASVGPQFSALPPQSVEDDRFVPIAMLNPHNPDFLIKGRVVKKNDIKQWNRGGRQGKLFSIEIMDKAQDTISATFFHLGCEKFFPLIEDGKVYVFAKGTVKYDNTRFNNTTSKYALTFDEKAQIIETGEDASIKKDNMHLLKLSQIEKERIGSRVDVAGVVQRCSAITELTSRAGEPLEKRVLSLVDDTKTSIELTLWNDSARLPALSTFNEQDRMVLVAKGVRVSDFNGISLSTINGVSVLQVNPPNMPELGSLWVCDTREITPLSKAPEARNLAIKPLSVIQATMENHPVESDYYFDVLGSIRYVKHDDNRPFFYESCKKCRKKVMPDGNVYMCHACNISSAECDFRYNILIRIQDPTNSVFATAFDEAATKIIRKSAEEMQRIRDTNVEEFEEQFQALVFKEFLFRIKARKEVSRSDSNIYTRFTVQNATPVDPVRVGKALVSDIVNSLNEVTL